MIPPFFDGRQPLTKEVMNDLVDAARRMKRMSAAPPLEIHDLGDAGQHIRLGQEITSNANEGFWAILDVADNQGVWYECVPGMDPDSQSPILIQKPGGRTGSLDPLCRLTQGMGNLRPRRNPFVFAVRFSPQASTGTFRLSSRIGSGTTFTTGVLNYDISAPALALELNAPTPGVSWFVSGIPGLAYYILLDPDVGNASESQISMVSNTTGSILNVAGETMLEPGDGISDLYNFLPGGQPVWVRPIMDQTGAMRYLFSLPYCGMFGRIVRLDRTVLFVRYIFHEQICLVDANRNTFMDDPSGLTGYCYEMNGEILVPPDTVVWMLPLFQPGSGWSWTFQALTDWRPIMVPASTAGYPSGTNSIILYARQQDLKSSNGTAYAYLVEQDGTPTGTDKAGTHLSLRLGSTVDGWPYFVRVGGETTGWSGTLNVPIGGGSSTLNLTIANGRVSSAVEV